MKTFLKIVLGGVVALALFMFLFIFTMMGLAGGSKSETMKPTANSILNLKLQGEVTDRTYENPLRGFSIMSAFSTGISTEATIGLFDLKRTIETAKTDDNIKGIYLNVDEMYCGTSTLFEIQKILEDFKKSGKFIYAYSNNARQSTFLLGNTADKFYMNPVGGCEFDGFVSENMFYTGLFEKLGVKTMAFYVGEYKSATEPFRLKQMSAENKIQMTELLNDIYRTYLTQLERLTKIPKDKLKTLADNLQITEPEHAMQNGLIDGLKYDDEFFAELKSKLGYKKDEKLNSISYNDYRNYLKDNHTEKDSKNKIAVIFAEGEINDGNSDDGEIGGEKYMHLIRKIRQDKTTKAIVLRVNSGGGSAFASEQIWRELKLAKEDKIPVIVSMGDYAASGGYYIACASDKVIATPTTLTGSIGVFGLLFNTKDLYENKGGITFDKVQTNPHADFGNTVRDWDELEKNTMQNGVNKIYNVFMQRVGTSRKMDTTAVNKIARGRVWTGNAAKNIGLVDELGNLDLAIKYAKDLAKLKDAEVVEYPKAKEFYDQFFDIFGSKKQDEETTSSTNFNDILMLKEIKYLNNLKGIQTRMPYEMKIK